MSIETSCTPRLLVTSFVLTCIASLTMRLAIAESIEGTATWRERMALPRGDGPRLGLHLGRRTEAALEPG